MNSSISNFKPQHFLTAFIALTLIMVTSVVAFNGWFYFNKPNSELDRAQKSEQGGYEVIVIGSSRANAYVPYFSNHFKVLNLSAGGAQPYEIKRRLQHALRYSNPQKIIIDLGFFSFNQYWPGSEAYSEYFFTTPQTHFDLLHRWKRFAMYSVDYRNIFKNLKKLKQSPQNKTIEHKTSPDMEAFRSTENFYMRNGYNPVPYKQYKLDSDIIEQELAAIIEIGYAHNIKLILITSPVHARLMQILDIMGLWPDMEQWKKHIINVNKRIATKYNQAPFPIYDAMIFSRSTTIHLEKSNELYTETSHFKPHLASKILKSIEQSPNQSSRDYVIISDQNINEHLKKQRAKKKSYNSKNESARNYFLKEYNSIQQQGQSK